MPFSKKSCLLVLLLSCAGLSSLGAQTNSDIDLFYSDTWQAAWDDTGEPYYNSKGHICFPHDDVLLARLEVFNYFFMPHPFNSFYQSIMLEKETKIIDLEVDLKLEQRKKRKMFFTGLGLGSAIATALFLIF